MKAADLQRDQAKVELSFAQRKAAADLKIFYEEAATSRAELESLRQSADLASESLRLINLRYQAGEATVLEVVDAQNTLTQTQNALGDGQERFRVALANLANSDRKILSMLIGRDLPKIAFLLITAALAAMVACSSDDANQTPVVPVEIVAVEKSAMQQTITADAVLFPVAAIGNTRKDQRAGEKIPGQSRKSRSRRATAGGAREPRPRRCRAGEQRCLTIRRKRNTPPLLPPNFRRNCRKRSLMRKPPKQQLDAQQKVYDSRQGSGCSRARCRARSLIRQVWI